MELKEIRSDIFGYFTETGETPEHDPGVDTICPICAEKLAEERTTISLALLLNRNRSYFYRTCRSCYKVLSEEDKDQLDYSLIDVLIHNSTLQ